jgi:hypothetical protein
MQSLPFTHGDTVSRFAVNWQGWVCVAIVHGAGQQEKPIAMFEQAFKNIDDVLSRVARAED